MTPESYRAHAEDFDEIEVIQSGKRCGMEHAPWMGDWFTSWSPRNGNSNAEGPWEHWVDLAVRILTVRLVRIGTLGGEQQSAIRFPRTFLGAPQNPRRKSVLLCQLTAK